MLVPLLAVAGAAATLLQTANGAALQPQLPFVAPSTPTSSGIISDVGNADVKPDKGSKSLKNDPDWNVLHHLAGISPYFNSHGPDPTPPEGCEVVNMAMIARHGSITSRHAPPTESVLHRY